MAKAAGKITRINGQIYHYRADVRYGAKPPTKARISEVMRQAKKLGATRAAIVAEVDTFQGYEMTRGERRPVRAYRKNQSLDALRGRLVASNKNTRATILSELRAATGAEDIHGLRNFQINFY